MAYLLAKYTLLFLLASVLGFVLGYWWSRRRMVDVTESYESMKSASARSDRKDWQRLFEQLDALPQPKETDLSGVTSDIKSLQTVVANIPTPKETDLSGVTSEIQALQTAVAGIPAPRETDLSGINSDIKSLQSAVAGIPTPKETDLSSVYAKMSELRESIANIPTPKDVDLSSVSSKLGALDASVAAIPVPEKPRDVDLSAVEQKLAGLQAAIREIPTVETHEATDISPITVRLESLERQISSLPRPEPVSFASVNSRLDKIEAKLKKPRKTTPSTSLPQPAKEGEPVILSAALYGKEDDLKRISGVGPKLEKLLHKNGVYYFWQVASWRPKDIEFIDDRLEVFKGRIARDSWVTQAKSLKGQPGAANMPG